MVRYLISFYLEYICELQEMLATVARKEANGFFEFYISSLVPYKNNLSDIVTVFTNSGSNYTELI